MYATVLDAAPAFADALGPALRSISSCIGHWPLDEPNGTNASDRTSNARNGTWTNGPILGREGFAPGVAAGDFDGGNDFVTVADNSAFRFTGTSSFSVHLWLARGANGATARVISKEATGSPWGGWFVWVSASGVITIDRETNDGTVDYPSTGVEAIQKGRWTQVVITYDGTNARTYINTRLDKTTARSNSCTSVTTPLRFMNDTSGVTGTLGRCAHVALFSAALSADQIKWLYQAAGL